LSENLNIFEDFEVTTSQMKYSIKFAKYLMFGVSSTSCDTKAVSDLIKSFVKVLFGLRCERWPPHRATGKWLNESSGTKMLLAWAVWKCLAVKWTERPGCNDGKIRPN